MRMYLKSCYSKSYLVRFLTFRNRHLLKIREYHSENVFGFRKKPKTLYKVSHEALKNRCQNSNFYRLVTAYREHGHKIANINPVHFNESIRLLPELDPGRYCLDTAEKVEFKGIISTDKKSGTILEAIQLLTNVYTKQLSAEFTHLETEEEVEWLAKKLENQKDVTDDTTKMIITNELIKSQAFDNFMANKFPGVKRYGGEGAESMMAFFSEVFKLSAKDDIQQIVLCMPHRGRLNILTGLLKFPPAKMFMKLRGLPDFPRDFQCTGDVLSHCISSVDLTYNNKNVHVTMLYNPSHLEAVNPVSMGKTRAKQMEYRDGDYSEKNMWSDKILNIQVHGDGAYSGQGVNQECLALSKAPHFEIGGSVHLIVNNQVGFTTPADRGRSSRYSTDLAKFISAPVIHVNGDFPEMVVKATKIAFEYQRKFRKDIFIDMNCYRQWGHNELDDPTFTNPSLYGIIRSRKTVPDLYAKSMVDRGLMTWEQINKIAVDHNNWLTEELKTAEAYQPEQPCFLHQWEGFQQASNAITTWETGVQEELLAEIGRKSVTFPETFNIHPHLFKTYVTARLKKIENGASLDWSTAEAMAFGSLLYQGYNVRISGQDVGRGTFSHRHIMLVDQNTNETYIPLNNIHPKQNGFLEVANSILSEEAVLGYEYGFSIECPKNLCIWEAQFGDFFNGAQIMIDTFVSSGETKWLWSSGLVMMLPHGYDGAGPEHSSSRIERFLQLSDSKEDKPDGDNVNMEICQPSTPAQYFHLLRRQQLRNYRKPLIIITPKTLLRLSACVSNLSDLGPGTWFLPVVGEKIADPYTIKKVILCSGKHYYSLAAKRQSLGLSDTAIVRLESFCPFPTMQLQDELKRYPNARLFIWSQEEPRNMGGWTFIKPRFENLVGRKLHYCGRDTMPTPAVGVGKWHQEQAEHVTTKPFMIDITNKI